jgi:iron complex transport system substrate-binding protein
MLDVRDLRRWQAAAALLLLMCPLRVAAATPTVAHRIVSLAPSLTETVFALGAGDRLVGVSVYCDFPPEAQEIDRVGTFLTPNVEAILAKRPDVVLAVPSPANQNPVQSLRHLGLRVLVVDPRSVAEILDSIRQIGAAIGRPEAAQRLVDRIGQDVARVRSGLRGAPERKVLMVVGRAPLIAAGAGTFADELIRLAHGINLGAQAGSGWPHLSIEFAIAAAPDVIIDTTVSHAKGSDPQASLGFWHSFATIPAVRHGGVHAYRDFQLLRPGPRITDALTAMARFIHPERFRGTVDAEESAVDSGASRQE